MIIKKLFRMFVLIVAGMSYQTSALAAPFDVFWQKCRAKNDKAALDACDKAHDLRPWDPIVQKRGDDLFTILEKQKKSGAPRPATQPQRPPPRPAPPPATDPFDGHWKKCRSANTQAALNSCKVALSLRRNNRTVQKRVNDLSRLLKPAPPPVRRIDPFDAQWRLCTTKNTQSALKACTEALKLRPTNQKVRVRKNQLTKLLNPPPPRQPVVVQRPDPAPAEQQRPEQPATVEKKPDVDKSVISQNQKILTRLGFDTGGTEGTIGKKTRKAIDTFKETSGVEISSKLGDQDLAKLEDTLELHEEAMQKYEVAKKEREEGDLKAALTTVEEAMQIVPWLASLHSLEKELKQEEKQRADEIAIQLDEDFKDLESFE